jgi:hypothetical protein
MTDVFVATAFIFFAIDTLLKCVAFSPAADNRRARIADIVIEAVLAVWALVTLLMM